MPKISRITQKFTSSSIRKMFEMANDMDNIVSFAVGEPDFTTPKNIIDAACISMLEGQTHYTSNLGLSQLRKAIVKKIQEDRNVAIDAESEVMVTAGGMEALMLSMMAIINPGDEVILTNPYWPNHSAQVSMSGGIPKYVRVYEEDGFVYNPENLRKEINKNTKAIIINSPANPTGGVIDRENLEEIADMVKEHDLYIISDEVYQHFVFDGEFISIASLNEMKDRTIIIGSFSKSYAMTGWRVGYAAGCREVIQNMLKLQENVVSCINTAAQFGAIEALEGTQEPLKLMMQSYDKRRRLIVDGINAIEGISCMEPKGAFYIFPNISKTGMTSEDFAIELLKNTGVVVVPGSGFGDAGEGFIRMSYATSEENIIEGLRRMKIFIEGSNFCIKS